MKGGQPVEATETPHTGSSMETATSSGASGLRASPRWPGDTARSALADRPSLA